MRSNSYVVASPETQQQVGASAESTPTSSFSKRFTSKNPRTRFEVINELFKNLKSEFNEEILNDYAKDFPKYLSDTDIAVQEKALECFTILITKINLNERCVRGCVAAIIEKYLKSPKSQLRIKATEELVLLCESDPAKEIVKEHLKEAMGVKVTPFILNLLTHLLNTFGSTSFPIKDFITSIVALIDSPNFQLKNAALNYLKEAYNWDNTSVIKAIKVLKPYQYEDIIKQIEVTLNKLSKPSGNIQTPKASNQTRNKKEVKLKTYRLNEDILYARIPKTPIESERKVGMVLGSKHKKHASTIIGEDVIMTIEDATKQVFSNVPISILAYFDMPAWNERELGFTELISWVQHNPSKAQIVMEASVIWLKRKFFDFTECTSQAAKQWLILIKTYSKFCMSTKGFAKETVPGLVDKMADSKVVETCLDILLSIADSVTPSFVVQLAITSGYMSKNALVMKNIMLLLERMLEGYGATLLPMKITIEYGKFCLAHISPQVNNAAINYFVVVYRQIGDSINQWLSEGINEEVMKSLKAEFEKVNMLLERKESLEEVNTRVNIAGKLSSKIILGLSDPSIKQRQEAKEVIEIILVQANYKILATGIDPLLNALKDRMSDSSKTLLKGFVVLVGDLVMALGKEFKQCNKSIIPLLIENIVDRQVHDEVVVAMNKIIVVDPELILKPIIQFIEKENFEIKLYLLQWLKRHKDLLNKEEGKRFLDSLIKAAKDNKTRKLVEELIKEVTTDASVSKMSFDNTIRMNVEKPNIKSPSKTNTPLIDKIVILDKKVESEKLIAYEASIEEVKDYLKGKVHSQLFEFMFSSESKETINAANVLREGVNKEFNDIQNILEVIYRWIVIRIINANNALTKALLDFIATLFKKMQIEKYKMNETELIIILPTLCEKTSITSTELKMQIINLIKKACQISPPIKVANCVLNCIKTTKTKRVKLECLNILKDIINKHGASKDFPLNDIKIYMESLNILDSSLKVLVLEILAEICKLRNGIIWESKQGVTKKVMLRNGLSSINVTDPKKTIEKPERTRRNNSSTEDSWSTPKVLIHYTKPSIKSSPNKRTPYKTILNEPICLSPANKSEQSDYELHSNLTESIELATNQRSKEVLTVSPLNLSIGQDEAFIKFDTLEQALETLKTGYISQKVYALMYLNEKAASHLKNEQEVLIFQCNYLMMTFGEILKESFKKPLNEIPLRFVKYFITVVSKICANKALVNGCSKESVLFFVEQLLTSLLYEGLHKVDEGEYLLKAFNSIMLRLLENFNPTISFITLINLFKTYRDPPSMIGNINARNLPNLILKCVLKLTSDIESLISSTNVAEVLICLNEFLQLSTEGSLNNPNGRIGIRMAKTIVNELVKIKGKLIWEDYNKANIKDTDTSIKKWINLLLASTHPMPVAIQSSVPAQSIDELKEIFKQINSQPTFKEGIKRLSEYLATNPHTDLSPYFVSCSKPFKAYIMESLKRYHSMNVDRSNYELSSSTIESQKDSPASLMSDYKSKLELLKQKFETNKSNVN